MSNRILYFDYIRIIAIFLVVACHCFGDTSNISPVLISLLTYIEMPCIGLFICLSGALLLPVKSSAGIFLKKRMNRIVMPTVIWSIIYMMMHNSLSINNIWGGVFHPVGSGILWFMYTISGLYIISPIISPWLEKASPKTIRLYLFLWVLTLCFPIANNWIEVDYSSDSWGYYISGYVGYFILGYYLRKYGLSLKMASLIYGILFCIMAIVKFTYPGIELYRGTWYLSIFGLSGVMLYWALLENFSKVEKYNSLNKTVARISNLVFGVYFVHIGLITYIIPHINIAELSYLPNYVIKVILTFVIGLFISWLISYLPFAEYLIGYKQKNNLYHDS